MPPARQPITVEVQPINIRTNLNVKPNAPAPIAPYQAPFKPNAQVVPEGVRIPGNLKSAAAGSGVARFGSGLLSGAAAVNAGLAASVLAAAATLEGMLAQPAGQGSERPYAPGTASRESVIRNSGVASPTQTRPKPYQPTQPQTQTQPKPYQPTPDPPKAPFDPSVITAPTPSSRGGLGDFPVTQKTPIKTDSPYPLDIVDINSYGGVNLNYPIAQKLNRLEQDLPQKIDAIVRDNLSKLKIETTTTYPVTTELTAKLPVSVDLATKLPVAVDLATKLPVSVDLATKLPVAVDLATKLPVSVDLATKLPVSVDLATKLPVSVDLATKLPVNVDVKAKLTPDTTIKPSLKKLKECCDDVGKKLKEVQEELKKKQPVFEGKGDIVCADGATTPYSYRGEGLTGLHQLINIILGVNKQILEKVCDFNFNFEYPDLQGGGVYDCDGTTVSYNYSGAGFIGLQNQIDQLFGLNTKILSEVCESATVPNIAGQIEYFNCDNQTQAILFSGNGVEGLSSQVTALTSLVKEVLRTACDSTCVPLMPDGRFEEFNVSRQLIISWGERYPTQNGSLWHTSIPIPKDGLNWCDHFENLSMDKGDVTGRVYWENSKIWSGSHFASEVEAVRVINQLVALSDANPHKENGEVKVRITTGGAVKRKPANRTVRAVRAVIASINEAGEPTNLICFTPPPEGCS